MKMYLKKEKVSAIQWNGNVAEISNDEIIRKGIKEDDLWFNYQSLVIIVKYGDDLQRAYLGDWIIFDGDNFYVVDKQSFLNNYEEVND